MDGDTIAATRHYVDNLLWIFHFDGTSLQRVVTDKTIDDSGTLLVDGDTVFTDSDTTGSIDIFEAADGYAGTSVPTAITLQPYQRRLFDVGDGRIFVGMDTVSQWLEKNGTWGLTPNNLILENDIGDEGLTGVRQLAGSKKNIAITRLADGTNIGTIQGRVDNGDFETNDVVFARGASDWVDIFVLETVVPPCSGCGCPK